MKLFYRKRGETGTPLVILHGLYGSGDNWMSIANELKEHFQVYLVDQRNHGRSPHSPVMDYDSLTNDLYDFFEDHNIKKAHIIGHSMGGKTAMQFTLDHPDRIKKLIVVDISPKTYNLSKSAFSNVFMHKKIIAAFKAVNPETAKSRQEIDSQMANLIPDIRLRQFLLKNIERDDSGKFRWRINISSIEKNIDKVMNGFSDLVAEGSKQVPNPCLLIKGELSDYVDAGDIYFARKLFPNAQMVTIPEAGHWLHAQQPKLFVKTVKNFLL